MRSFYRHITNLYAVLMDLNVDVYPQKPAGIIGLALHEISFHHNEKTMIE